MAFGRHYPFCTVSFGRHRSHCILWGRWEWGVASLSMSHLLPESNLSLRVWGCSPQGTRNKTPFFLGSPRHNWGPACPIFCLSQKCGSLSSRWMGGWTLQLSHVPLLFPMSPAAESPFVIFAAGLARSREGGCKQEKSCRGIWPCQSPAAWHLSCGWRTACSYDCRTHWLCRTENLHGGCDHRWSPLLPVVLGSVTADMSPWDRDRIWSLQGSPLPRILGPQQEV